MDMHDIFRGFFGFNRMPPDRFENPFPFSHGSIDSPKDGDDDEILERRDHFSDSFFDDEFPNMFRQIEDIFNNMFSIHSGFLDFPNLEMPSEEFSPRDFMLKEPESPYEKPQCIQPSYNSQRELRDSDLDDKIAKEGLSVISERPPLLEKQPKSWSFCKSVSTRVVRSPNGVIEEHKSVTDGDGKTITTVRKTIGDKSYQVTTESDKTGLVEKKEDFINMDEKDIQKFEQEWGKAKSTPVLPPSALLKEPLPDAAPPGDPKYFSLFKKFFG